MKMRRISLVLMGGLVAGLVIGVGTMVPGAFGQAKDKQVATKRVAIRAGRLIDGKSDAPVANALIVIEGDKIVSVTPGGTAPAGVELIDLSKATVHAWFRGCAHTRDVERGYHR